MSKSPLKVEVLPDRSEPFYWRFRVHFVITTKNFALHLKKLASCVVTHVRKSVRNTVSLVLVRSSSSLSVNLYFKLHSTTQKLCLNIHHSKQPAEPVESVLSSNVSSVSNCSRSAVNGKKVRAQLAFPKQSLRHNHNALLQHFSTRPMKIIGRVFFASIILMSSSLLNFSLNYYVTASQRHSAQ